MIGRRAETVSSNDAVVLVNTRRLASSGSHCSRLLVEPETTRLHQAQRREPT